MFKFKCVDVSTIVLIIPQSNVLHFIDLKIIFLEQRYRKMIVTVRLRTIVKLLFTLFVSLCPFI